MSNANKGWIKIYRSLEDNWIWQSDKHNRQSAWIDLLLMANHNEQKVNIGNSNIIVQPGQRWTSLPKLADRWGWSVKKVRAYLTLLENDEMIYANGNSKGTLITIRNYKEYQTISGNEGTQKGMHRARTGNAEETQRKRTGYTNNNDKELLRMTNNDKEMAAPPEVYEE